MGNTVHTNSLSNYEAFQDFTPIRSNLKTPRFSLISVDQNNLVAPEMPQRPWLTEYIYWL